jgi:hypothetical protein
VEDGRWKTEDGRWKMEGGRRKTEDEGWKKEGGRWKVEGGRGKLSEVKTSPSAPLPQLCCKNNFKQTFYQKYFHFTYDQIKILYF